MGVPKVKIKNVVGTTKIIRVKTQRINRSHLKKAFCPNFCVGTEFQLLEILQYVCGLKLGPAFLPRQSSAGELEPKSYFRDGF
jgi:hypothetical protein